jgi:flagellum-specific ATP synthase
MPAVVSEEQHEAAGRVRELLSIFEGAQDLINIGAYRPGSNPKVDWALSHIESVDSFLTQGMNESFSYDDTLNQLLRLAPR